MEILKHLDGDLTILPLPAEALPEEIAASRTGPRHPFEIRCRIKRDSLLAMNQEAACGTLVAGAGNAECYTAPETSWIDLRLR
jgi:hypothetical protein